MMSGVEVMKQGERFLTTSLDGHLKAFNLVDMSVTYQEKFKHPILHFSLSEDDK